MKDESHAVTRPNIKGCIAARNEPENAPMVEHGLAAVSAMTQALFGLFDRIGVALRPV